MSPCLRASLFLHFVAPLALAAQPVRKDAADVPGDSAWRAVAPGLALRHVMRPDGPWWLHVLAVDLRAPGVRVEGAHALDAVAGRERTSDAAARWCAPGRRAVAAVNGDLFDLATGAPEGSQVVGGAILKAAARTDSPFDTFDNTHTQLALTADGGAAIGRWSFAGALRAGDRAVPLDGVNAPRAPGAALFTPAAGARTPSDSTRRDVLEAPFTVTGLPRGATWRDWPRAGDTLRLRRSGAPNRGGGTAIPERGVVLAAREGTPAAAWLAPDGPRELTATLAFEPDPASRTTPLPAPPRTLLGGWGRLVAGGEVVAARADSLEGTFPRFSAARHPRTAVGLTRGGDTLLLVVVDGRSARSVGMTFAELGAAMRSLGAWDAVNLDGGGSSAMIVRGAIVSVPSDSAGERTVGNMLLVTRPEAGRRCPAPLPRPKETPRYDRRDPDTRPARRPG